MMYGKHSKPGVYIDWGEQYFYQKAHQVETEGMDATAFWDDNKRLGVLRAAIASNKLNAVNLILDSFKVPRNLSIRERIAYLELIDGKL